MIHIIRAACTYRCNAQETTQVVMADLKICNISHVI